MALISGEIMNDVYEQMKTMTVSQIEQCKVMSWKFAKMGVGYMKAFESQCDFAISKKLSGDWK